jgi:Leucine-rich repeat (LRR) protein
LRAGNRASGHFGPGQERLATARYQFVPAVVVCLLSLFLSPCSSKDVTSSPSSKTASETSGDTTGAARIVLHFPQGKPVGKLVLLQMGKERETYSETAYAIAQGDIIVARGAIFLLEVNYQGATDLSFLNGLPPGVIAGLRIKKLAIADAQFMALGGMKYMKTLDLCDMDITDRGIMHLKDCSQLLELCLNSSLITGKGLVVLQDLKQLVSLTLDQDTLDDASMASIGCLKNLMWLRLQGSNIGDAGVAHLKSLSHLRKLVISGNKRITDASIPNILALKSLRKLDATDCKITAAGLMQLKKLPELRQVMFGFNDYTLGQVDQIKRAMPAQCKVVDGRKSKVPLEMFSPLH